MFSFEINNNEFQINTRLVGGSDIDPTMLDVTKMGEILKLQPGTFDRIIDPSGSPVDIDTYHKNRADKMDLWTNDPAQYLRINATCLANPMEYNYFTDDTCQKMIDSVLETLGQVTTKQMPIDEAAPVPPPSPPSGYIPANMISQNSLTWTVNQLGPKALVNMLVALGVKGETASNGHIAPVSYGTWEASIKAGDAGNRGMVSPTTPPGISDWDRWTNGHSTMPNTLDTRKDGLQRLIMYLTTNYQWINPGKLGLEPTVPDVQTGVKYNQLKQNVDIEAMQYEIQKKHASFKVSVQGLFGTVGINPQFTFGISPVQGGGYKIADLYTVTEEQFKGGALPAMMPLSLVSKVPSFSEDIEKQIRKNIALLKVEGKNLTPTSQQQIDSAISGMKSREQQLTKMVESFERMVRDKSFSPSGPGNTITMDDVLKYADKVKTGQTKLADILKVLANIVPASTTSTLSTV